MEIAILPILMEIAIFLWAQYLFPQKSISFAQYLAPEKYGYFHQNRALSYKSPLFTK